MATSMNLNSASVSDSGATQTTFTIPSLNTDSATGQEEVSYQNTKWSQQWGYFNSIPDLKNAILMKALWIVGKGYTTDPETEVILDHISGWGKDTFHDVLFNMIVTRMIGGDSYAEIIRDGDTIVNLKPLDTGAIKIIVGKNGRIKRYEQLSKITGEKVVWQPEDILHLSENRLADQIHGISVIDAVEDVILSEAESSQDMKKIMHAASTPVIMFKLGTDNAADIAAFRAKMDAAIKSGSTNIYIPSDKNTVEYEVVQVNVSNIVLAWRDDLRNKFYRTVGLPQIIASGSGQSSESESKVVYYASEQNFAWEQLKVEKQLYNQLLLKIKLVPPTSLLNDLQTDQSKDGSMLQMNMQPSDLTAGVGR